MNKKAFIRDGALVLYFDAAENPVVARFDLESLAQANFEVVKKEPNFVLALKDFAGQEQIVAQFASKADAHQALYAIMQALLEHSGSETVACAGKSSGWCRFFKWILWIFLILVVAYVGILFLTPSVSHETATAPEAASAGEAAPSSDAADGEAIDLDDMLSDTGKTQ